MLIVFPTLPKRPMFVLNLDDTNAIWIDTVTPPKVFLKIDGQSIPFETVKEAEDVINGIVDAYEQGLKVYRIVRGRTA